MKQHSWLLLFVLFLSCGTQKISNYENANVVLDGNSDTSNLEALITPFRESMEKEMTVVIGEAETTLDGSAPESTLGNFAAEATYLAGLEYGESTKEIGPEAMKRSFSLINFGGLRSVINQGDITIGNMYELMPFDNTLTLVKLSGDDARRCAQYLFEANGQPVYNATFKLSQDSQEMTIGGDTYSFDEDVVVVTSNYLAAGGDKMNFFKDPIAKWDSGIFLRDVFINRVKTLNKLGAFSITDKIQILSNE